jgi:hypothetical protein
MLRPSAFILRRKRVAVNRHGSRPNVLAREHTEEIRAGRHGDSGNSPVCGGEFSPPSGGISRPGRRKPSKTRRFRDVFVSVRLAQLLPLDVMSIHVFRPALFSVVLTLAMGQSAGLLCKVWCHDAASAACPHHESATSASVRADDTCTDVAVAAVAFGREDGRRTAPDPDGQNALVVLRFRLVTPPTDPRPGYESGRRLLLEERPPAIALRI